MTIREANRNDLNEILQLYLYLHEKSVPEDTGHLRNTWESIVNDPNHHLISIGMPDTTVRIRLRLYSGLICELYVNAGREKEFVWITSVKITGVIFFIKNMIASIW